MLTETLRILLKEIEFHAEELVSCDTYTLDFNTNNKHDTEIRFQTNFLDVEYRIMENMVDVKGKLPWNNATVKHESTCSGFGYAKLQGKPAESDRIIKVKEELEYDDITEGANFEPHIEIEEVNIKLEGTDCERPQDTAASTQLFSKNTNELESYIYQNNPKLLILYKCQTCRYETTDKADFDCHSLGEEHPEEPTCVLTSENTRHKLRFNKAEAIRGAQNCSQIKMHKCENCLYETKHKSYLRKHMLIHKDRSELTIYKCETCTYETHHKGNLKQHTLIHQSPLEVIVYKCKMCPYEAKHKSYVSKHMLIHKSVSEITMYDCEECPFKTRCKGNLTKHMRVHQSPWEIKMYKCEMCSYETKHKGSLIRHMLTHKSFSETTVYRCDKCSFETKFKHSLKKHFLTHRKAHQRGTHRTRQTINSSLNKTC